MTDKQEFNGKKVTVVGLGIEGEDITRYFLSQGATVTVSDARDRAALGARATAVEALGAHLSLGRNDPADTLGADLVCASQGVPLGIPAIAVAREHGVPVTSMTKFFLDRWQGPILGITGSSGKTTTTSLVNAIFDAAGRDHVLGGNIGIGLLHLLDQNPDLGGPVRWAVIEVSHTQLTLVDRSPHIGGLLNVTPNHLDQFTWDEYVELKSHIFSFQTAADRVVFNADDPVSQDLRPRARARQFLFSTAGDHGCDGAFVMDETVFRRLDGRVEPVVAVSEIGLRGAHNVANVAAAVALAAAADISAEACREAVLAFRAPPHRIELVGIEKGVRYYDDSIATAPERTVAALRSFAEPVVLLLGGRDKNLPLEQLADEVGSHCRVVLGFGEAGALFTGGVAGHGVPVERFDTLAEALAAARSLAQPGDAVLLSPAGVSFDAYPNFERRGDHFRALVAEFAEAPV